MGVRDSSIAVGAGARNQFIMQRLATDADQGIGATLPKLTIGNPVRANGRIKRVFAYHETTALVGGGTTPSILDVQPHIIDTGLAAPFTGAATGFPIPVTALTALEMSSVTDVLLKPYSLDLGDDTDESGVTGSNSTATELVLTGGSAVNGYYVGAGLDFINSAGVAFKRKVTKYIGSTKAATIATTSTAVSTGGTWKIKPRRRIVRKGDVIIFLLEFTIGTGTGSPAAGADLLCGVEIEFDDRIS